MVTCGTCGDRVVPSAMEYHMRARHSVSQEQPKSTKQSRGLRFLKAVGFFFLGWFVIGTGLAVAAAFVAPGVEIYMPVVGFVVGLIMSIRSWQRSRRVGPS